MISDYYFIGGCIAYVICVGVCAYCGSEKVNDAHLNCLLCCSKEDKNDYSLINV